MIKHFGISLTHNGITYLKYAESTADTARIDALLAGGYVEVPSAPPSMAHRFVNGEWSLSLNMVRHFYNPITGRYSHSSELPPDDVPAGFASCSSKPPDKSLYTTSDGLTWTGDAAATLQAAKVRLEGLVEQRLESLAQAHDWRNLDSARIAAGYPNTWQAEGIAFVQHWDSTWRKCFEILAAAQQGQKYNPAWVDVIPTETELLAELPILMLT